MESLSGQVQDNFKADRERADYQANEVRSALLFLLNYGVSGEEPALGALHFWLSDPMNLMAPSKYIDKYREGTSKGDLLNLIQEIKGAGKTFIEDLSRSTTLRPSPSVLESQIQKLGSIH